MERIPWSKQRYEIDILAAIALVVENLGKISKSLYRLQTHFSKILPDEIDALENLEFAASEIANSENLVGLCLKKAGWKDGGRK